MSWRLHWHDYKMEFDNSKDPFDWTFICKCGDTVKDPRVALSKMKWWPSIKKIPRPTGPGASRGRQHR
jgi:hypothetical protein